MTSIAEKILWMQEIIPNVYANMKKKVFATSRHSNIHVKTYGYGQKFVLEKWTTIFRRFEQKHKRIMGAKWLLLKILSEKNFTCFKLAQNEYDPYQNINV